jgi:hypothetical protein
MFKKVQPGVDTGEHVDTDKAADPEKASRRVPPQTKENLRNYIKTSLGIEVPDRRICPGHKSPMDYLWHTFSYDFELRIAGTTPGNWHPPSAESSDCGLKTDPLVRNGDAIVWANRGGGKTQTAAIATLLDAIFKPRCQIRILGGSGEQSLRMYEYLAAFLQRGYQEDLAETLRKGKCRFNNGAAVEILRQSATSVRGTHVQKLRCDEVELFRPEVFAAAKFTTQSTDGIVAAMELISTMHRPYGLMQKEVAAAADRDVPVFQWCVWETIEPCVGRTCSQCRLWGDCQGRAQRAGGYLKIDDCIAQMRRSSRAGWESEMLCLRPSLENAVFADFDPDTHVRPVDYSPSLPLYRTLDFGFVNPFVCLWIQVDDDGIVRVIDEYVRCQATIDVHATVLKARTPCPEERVAATYCDPAGTGQNDVSGTSAVRELRSLGIVVKYSRSTILEGIELIRRAIRSGDGKSSLVIAPNCPRLIEALRCYHYPDTTRAAGSEQPFKDGVYDHPIDALRYFFVNHRHSGAAKSRPY